MITAGHIDTLDTEQLREAVRPLLAEVADKRAIIERRDREAAFNRATIDKLTHEMAVLKRLKFAAQSEKYGERFNAEQKSLLEEAIDADLAALAQEIEQRQPAKTDKTEKQQPKRAALPPELPRTEHRHEPESTTCSCGCQLQRIGQDVAEKLTCGGWAL